MAVRQCCTTTLGLQVHTAVYLNLQETRAYLPGAL